MHAELSPEILQAAKCEALRRAVRDDPEYEIEVHEILSNGRNVKYRLFIDIYTACKSK